MSGPVCCDDCLHGIGAHDYRGGTELGACHVDGCDCSAYYRDPERLAEEAEARNLKAQATQRAKAKLGIEKLDRDDVIKFIRESLRKRSGKAWSVTGGRGTAWGWINVSAPPRRSGRFGEMCDEDIAELSALLGTRVHHQGFSVPDSDAHYLLACARAATGETMGLTAEQYWD